MLGEVCELVHFSPNKLTVGTLLQCQQPEGLVTRQVELDAFSVGLDHFDCVVHVENDQGLAVSSVFVNIRYAALVHVSTKVQVGKPIAAVRWWFRAATWSESPDET